MEQGSIIGLRIKDLRQQCGISQIDLAKKINVSKQTLYKYENGVITNIPSDKIEELARVFKVSPAYLMGWQSSPIIMKSVELTQTENEILLSYRNSDTKTKHIICELLDVDFNN